MKNRLKKYTDSLNRMEFGSTQYADQMSRIENYEKFGHIAGVEKKKK